MKNQVIRIIFDDPINKEDAKSVAEHIIMLWGNMAAIEVYEQEFTDEDNKNGKEQREEKPK